MVYGFQVSETTLLDVTVSFPSTLSLRSYFATDRSWDCLPELDERFVMSSNQAKRILHSRIPSVQVETEKRQQRFWLVAPPLDAELPLAVPDEEEDDPATQKQSIGSCLLALKHTGVVGWGIRRKVKYIGRHRESIEPEEKQQRTWKRRTREETKKKEKTRKKKKLAEEGRCPRGTKDRWSTERYEAAEKRLLDIMRTKKAELGRPILRQVLREEARKHIGDTGLLDHLLKHMAGKIVSCGSERFRRRHNSEGAMEYWLEPADMVEVRRKAGVDDPYWENCQILLDWKSKMEEELVPMRSSMQKLKVRTPIQIILLLLLLFSFHKATIHTTQEEVQLLKEEGEVIALAKGRSGGGFISTVDEDNGNKNDEISAAGGRPGVKKAVRRSGFRICKPQGTFLWPRMVASVITPSPRAKAAEVAAATACRASTGSLSCSLGQQQQQHLMILGGGGPPSASSSSESTPRLLLLPAPCPTSPCMLQPRSHLAIEEVVVPDQPKLPERSTGAESRDLWYSPYGAWKGNAVASTGGWAGAGGVGITTDLALATPSPYRRMSLNN
ncbi:Protein DYAD [Apostasia shenzhenica]|uniref:Protein DYAD n=1 Tax=Apostasia shenzhenica TaxID=1088818 RepID=A0A2H9ZR35_9ASPA|nr:Protein DYAD [Apostasia shenzhenica]